MTIAVVGATGRTGRQLVIEGLRRGHSVKAVARHPEDLDIQHENLVLETVDVLDRESLSAALGECESVISALGVGTSRKPTTVYSQGTENELFAMGNNHIRKLVAISAVPAGPKSGLPVMARTVGIPLLNALFGATYRDMRRMEQLLSGSEVSWIALRPPRLVDKPARGTYRLDENGLPSKGRSITCADLAGALLDVLDRVDLFGKSVYVSN
jgi:putative NADH-flavin reductase